MEFIENREHVARRDEDDVWLEILDQANLPFRHAARHRNDRHAKPLGAVVEADPAGKQAIAIRILHQHSGLAPGRAHTARHQVCPVVEIAPAVADDRGLAGGARRSVHAQHLVARNGEHPEWILLAQVVFGGKRKSSQVVE